MLTSLCVHVIHKRIKLMATCPWVVLAWQPHDTVRVWELSDGAVTMVTGLQLVSR